MQQQSCIKQYIQKADLFKLPFQFTFTPEKNISRTFCGGLLSIIIYFIGASYYIYLCLLYYGNRFQPTTSYLLEQTQQSFLMEFNQNFITTQIILADQSNIIDYERNSGKLLLNKFVEVIHTEEQTQKKYNFKLSPCKEEELQDRFCISFFDKDSENMLQTLMIQYNPKNILQDKLQFILTFCKQEEMTDGQICETDDTIRKQLLGLTSYMEVQIQMNQFETKEKVLKEKIRKEQFYFDHELVFFSKMVVKKSDTTVIDGFILQERKTISYFSDYRRVDQFVSKSTLKQQNHYSDQTVGILSLQLGQDNDTYQIQYILYPELLAQFFGFFKCLLLLGYVSRYLAKKEMFSEFISLQLQTYYKKTAIELMEKKTPNCKQTFENIFTLFNYVKTIDFRNNLSYYFNFGFYKKLTMNYKDNINENQIKTREQYIFNQLIQKSQKSLDIFEVQKDLIQIKTILKLLLTVEQYAAVQLCGSKINCEPSSLNSSAERTDKLLINNNESQQSKLKIQKKIELVNTSIDQEMQKQNLSIQKQQEDIILKVNSDRIINSEEDFCLKTHLEKIDLIEQDQNCFKKNVENFIINSQNSSGFDKRILECMIGQNIIKPDKPISEQK